MMSGMAAFMAAVGGTSLICYLLMNRVQRGSASERRRRRFRHKFERQFRQWRLEPASLVRQRQFFVG
jgi:hypothetical protein